MTDRKSQFTFINRVYEKKVMKVKNDTWIPLVS